ncbi:MAG TPA: lysophospholipid acyltransferase family protein [Xanthomonadaceae bacterium]|jgi:1-acyl-sn-glycerol-3-phosphate acyltransferase|nr:lysophospholipid acyltransferase family protein [Xanthomonadaceae bacterium]
MRDRVNYLWRIVATGLSFLSFGIGGVIQWLLIFPCISLLVRDPQRRSLHARAVIHRSFALFVQFMRRMGVLTFEIRGVERLQRNGLLILANHPTLLDVVFLISLIPNADCVVKSRLARNPFTRGPVKASGYVCNDSGSGLVDDCIASVRSGKNLVIFPEGTRTPRNGHRHLQRGAAYIALRGALSVTPVVIRCSPPTLSKGEPWYRVPPRCFHVTVEVGVDLPVAPFLAGTTEAIAARRLTDHLVAYFDTGCASAGS